MSHYNYVVLLIILTEAANNATVLQNSLLGLKNHIKIMFGPDNIVFISHDDP